MRVTLLTVIGGNNCQLRELSSVVSTYILEITLLYCKTNVVGSDFAITTAEHYNRLTDKKPLLSYC